MWTRCLAVALGAWVGVVWMVGGCVSRWVGGDGRGVSADGPDPTPLFSLPTAKTKQSIVMTNVAEDEEDVSSEDDNNRCSGIKADGSHCNFPVSDFELGMCRRCAAKSKRQAQVRVRSKSTSERKQTVAVKGQAPGSARAQ